jgi:hypothetical protein
VNVAAQIAKLISSAIQSKLSWERVDLLKRKMSAHLLCRILIQHVKRESRTQVCCDERAANSATACGKPARLISLSRGKPSQGAAEIKGGETTLVSLGGMAGNDELESSSSLHPQSPHSHAKVSALQQQGLDLVGFDEQQLF